MVQQLSQLRCIPVILVQNLRAGISADRAPHDAERRVVRGSRIEDRAAHAAGKEHRTWFHSI